MGIPVARPYLGPEEEKAAAYAVRSGWVSQGPRVREFEEMFASYVGAQFAVATTSCTTALHAALLVLGVGRGDEVVVPSLSFIATANAVIHAGATPVFADIDPDTCNVTAETIREVITPRTRAVMPVHQMGLPVDLDPIMALCRSRGVQVIEDAACAIGSSYKGKKIGGHGNLACFSFHPRKVITTGEGGMITTDDPGIAERLRRLRHHGMSVSDLERHSSDRVVIETYPEVGYNYRMTDIQAAIGIVQMGRLDAILARRKELARGYDSELSKISCLRVPQVPDYADHNYQSYWVEVLPGAPRSRDDVMQGMLDRGIATRRGIMAIHLEQCYRIAAAPLPVTERLAGNSILLPIYPTLSVDQKDHILKSMEDLLV